jgi:hypothetical protein
VAYSAHDLIEELQRVADELGDSASIDDFREHGSISVTTYYDRFGSWNEAIEAAGYNPNSPQEKIAEEELIEELHRVADEINGKPTVAQMNNHGEYWVSTYKNRFGSWTDALKAAGYDVNRDGSALPREDLLTEIERLADELGTTPTHDDMEAKGRYAARTYYRQFGSWNDALEAAGFKPHSPGKAASDEDLLREIERLATVNEGAPTAKQMDTEGKYSSATYQRRFGSWSAAVDKALDR